MNVCLADATFDHSRMAKAVEGDASNATDLADYLVRKGMPFREAHEVVGRISRNSIESNRPMESLSVEELKAFSPLLDAGAIDCLKWKTAMSSRTSRGGTAPDAVVFQIKKAKEVW